MNKSHFKYRTMLFLGAVAVVCGFFVSAKIFQPKELVVTNTENEEETTELEETSSQKEALSKVEVEKDNSTKLLFPQKSLDVVETPNGSISKISVLKLSPGKTNIIDLSEYDGSFLAIEWTEGRIKYSLCPTTSCSLEELEISDNSLPSDKTLFSELVPFNKSENQYLLLQPERSDIEVKAHLVEPTPSNQMSQKTVSATGQYNINSGAKYTTLDIISRDDWGIFSPGNPGYGIDIDDPARLSWTPAYHPISRIVVHHTATLNNPSDPAAEVRAIYLYHAYSRGWGDIGYNFIIDHLGNIYEGKLGGDEVFGYHAFTEANAMSMGVSLLGNFTGVFPTASAQDALMDLMAEKAAFYDFDLNAANGSLNNWLNLSYTVFGHRDTYHWDDGWVINSTACPGNALESLLGSLSSWAQDRKNTQYSEIKAVVSAVDGLYDESVYPYEYPCKLGPADLYYPDKFFVVFDLPQSASEEEVLQLIPSFSGILSVEVQKNMAIITVKDWNNGGVIDAIPPYGWDGYYGPGTFFPSAEGSRDRIKTLLKIFLLDSHTQSAGIPIGDKTLFINAPN